MKKNILIVATLLLSASAWAQGELDAFRMSGTDLQGTARGQAMGGAFGALGGDVTGIAINPAGLGVYNSSEISASLAFSSVGIKNPTKTENKSKINFDNINYVGNYQLNGEQKLNFGFSFNRLKNFDRRYTARGNWQPHSLTDFVANSSKGIPAGDANYDQDPWLSVLGWETRLINDISSDEYVSALANGEKVNSRLTVSEKGYVESYDFSLGTNISNKLYLGLTFSLTNLSYHLNSTYSEDFERGGNEGFDLGNYFETEGTGCQVNVGAIWLPTDWLRLGVAYHSPTIYTMTDYFQAKVDSKVDGVPYSTNTPGDQKYADYNFHTPQRWVFSAAGILGSQAILSLDYEIKDYAQSQLYYSDGVSKEEANVSIQESAKTASTLRAGLEYRFTPQFSGRLGLSYVQNPYKDSFREGKMNYNDGAIAPAIVGTVPHYTLEGDATYLTAGIGYKITPATYLDAAVIYKTQTENLFFYPGSDPVALKSNTTKAVITLGYKF